MASLTSAQAHSHTHSGRKISLDFHLDSKNQDKSVPSTNSSSQDTLTSGCGSSSSQNEETFSSTSTSTSTSSAPSLQSLAGFIHTNLKPFGQKGYNSYATSYITSAIPRLDWYPDDIGPVGRDPHPPPFRKAVRIKEFQVREKRRKELGQSLRKEWIIPQSKPILKEIHVGKKGSSESKTNLQEQHRFLLHKAQQWCEINKALYVDQKYPKIDPKILRKKYSEEHRIACGKAKRIAGLSDKAKIYKPTTIHSFPIPMDLVTATQKLQVQEKNGESESIRKMSLQVLEEEKGQIGLRQELKGIFDEIKPIPDSTVTEDNPPWQFIARKTATIKPKVVKKPPFKRTEYPVLSKGQKITQLRQLLPPPKSPELETDYLSGIWEPILDIDDFHITPPGEKGHDRGVGVRGRDDDGGKVEIDWFTMQETKNKCKRWLEANPDIW